MKRSCSDVPLQTGGVALRTGLDSIEAMRQHPSSEPVQEKGANVPG